MNEFSTFVFIYIYNFLANVDKICCSENDVRFFNIVYTFGE